MNEHIDLERVSLRKDPTIPVVVIREHLIRYIYAMQSIADKDVLDVACGSGYGMFLMSFLTKSVSGYDYSEEAITEAKKFEYRSPVCLEVRDLNTVKTLSNEKVQMFDVITCFETIEHLDDPDKFIEMLKQHLNPNGVLFLSTPNKPDGVDLNPWHKTAFNVAVMKNLIMKHFDISKVRVTMNGMNQLGISDDLKKPYLIVKIEL